MSTKKSLGSILKEARVSAGLTMLQVAAALEVSDAYIAQIEGSKLPSPDKLPKLANLLGLSLTDLTLAESIGRRRLQIPDGVTDEAVAKALRDLTGEAPTLATPHH